MQVCVYQSLKPSAGSGSDQSKHIHTVMLTHSFQPPLGAMLLKTRGPKCLTDGLVTNTTVCPCPQVFPVFGLAVIYSILT